MKKGFTLLELIITVSILSILVMIFLFTNKSSVPRAKEQVKSVNVSSIQNALTSFVSENNSLPLKKRVAFDSLSSDAQRYIEETLRKEEKTSQIDFIKDHLYVLDSQLLRPYLKTNRTLENFVIVDDISPYLRGFLFAIDSPSFTSPSESFLENKDDEIIQISRGYDHVLVLLKNGDVYGWGSNIYGQLGNGTTQDVAFPTLLHQNISYMLGSGHHTVVKKIDGTWMTWGRNTYGQLGDGTFANKDIPQPFTLPVPESEIQQFISSGNHSLLLLKDGRLLEWGYNPVGNRNQPTFVKKKDGTLLTDVVQIEIGNWASFSKTKDGIWYAWGRNHKGSLGDGTETNQEFPVEMKQLSPYYNEISSIDSAVDYTLFVLKNGEVLSLGNNAKGQLGSPSVTSFTLTPVKVETDKSTLQNIKSVTVGNDFSVAVSYDGTSYTWGDNTYGELCNTDSSKSLYAKAFPFTIHNISVQGYRIFFTKADGNLWGCGANTYGQMGDGTKNHHFEQYPIFQPHKKKDL